MKGLSKANLHIGFFLCFYKKYILMLFGYDFKVFVTPDERISSFLALVCKCNRSYFYMPWTTVGNVA